MRIALKLRDAAAVGYGQIRSRPDRKVTTGILFRVHGELSIGFCPETLRRKRNGVGSCFMEVGIPRLHF